MLTLPAHFVIVSLIWTAAFVKSELSTKSETHKEKPIVIHTPIQNYDTPTLNEYQECHANLDKCQRVCDTSHNPQSCKAECPICPLLFQHDLVIQGINDTELRSPVEPSVNTTNVIKLTNEIHNFIDNKMGNITANNENNIHVHNTHNVSHSGGKFGMGYNERGSCCLVIRRAQNCNVKKFLTGVRCHHHKRLRVCGDKCKARVMYAKLVKHCNDDSVDQDCQTRMTYVPYHHHRAHRPRCRYSPMWPYVVCGHSMPCQRCLQLSYGFILFNGVPRSCMPCYSQLNPPHSLSGEMGATWPEERDYDYDFDEDFIPPGNDWRIAKKKCRQADGTIVNCDGSDDVDGSGYSFDEQLYARQSFDDDDENVFEEREHNDIYDGEVEEQLYDEDERFMEGRRRRETLADQWPKFQRSKYSHRYKSKIVQ